MANSKVTGLGAISDLSGADVMYLVDGAAADAKMLAGDFSLLPDGILWNGKLSVTVSSNNLTVAIKTRQGNNPSSSEPVTVYIGGTKRRITAALSVTKNAGTNWGNAGSSEMATNEIDWFPYLGWNTTPATDIVDIGFSRYPYGRVYSDFSTTSTNEKYLAFGNASTPTSTDEWTVIGRFAATLSAGAGYTWSVPTFTQKNLIHTPIYESRLLDWTPTWSASGSMTFTSVSTTIARYQFASGRLKAFVRGGGTIGGTPSTGISATLPFESSLVSIAAEIGVGTGDSVMGRTFLAAGTPDLVTINRYDGANWTAGSRIAAAEIEYWA